MNREVTFENEEWKEIPGFEGYYEASSYGRIKSLDREILQRNGKTKRLKGKVLSTPLGSDGRYYVIVLYCGGKKYMRNVHRFIALTFVSNPDNLKEVNHLDGNGLNNHIDNLEWVSPKGNMAHAIEHGLLNPAFGENSGKSKLTEEDVIEIRNLYYFKNFTSIDLEKKFQVDRSAIHSIIKGEHWKHIPLPDNIDINIGRKRVTGSNNKNTSLTENQVSEIKTLYFVDKKTMTELCKLFSVKRKVLRRILNGETWQHVKFPEGVDLSVRNEQIKLTQEQKDKIREQYKSKELGWNGLAEKYGVSTNTIGVVVKDLVGKVYS